MYTIVKVNNLTHELTILCDDERISLIIPETHNTTSELKKEYIDSFLAERKLAKEEQVKKASGPLSRIKAAISSSKLVPYLLAVSIIEAIVIIVIVLKSR